MNVLKAGRHAPASNAIVVSFHSEWQHRLESGQVDVFFRKRGPRSLKPGWAYVYLGAPESVLVGRLPIKEHRVVGKTEALEYAHSAGMTEIALSKYLEDYTHVDTFFVSSLEPAGSPRRLAWLKANFGFNPPQSFMVLSETGQEALDSALGFAGPSRELGR